MIILFYSSLGVLVALLTLSYIEGNKNERFFGLLRSKLDNATYTFVTGLLRSFTIFYREATKTIQLKTSAFIERTIRAVEHGLEKLLVKLLDMIRGKRVLRHTSNGPSAFLQDVREYKNSLPRR